VRAHHRPAVGSEHGISYVEVLVAMVLIGVCLAPGIEALHNAFLGVQVGQEAEVDLLAVQAKLEEVLVQPFADLDAAAVAAGSATTPTSYSDAAPYTTTDGRPIVRQVYIWPYDGDNADGDSDPFTGTDAGILWVKVAIDGTTDSLQTLTTW